eukprot:scaffold21542_cov129-Skeletonema_marinoi.AAC.1
MSVCWVEPVQWSCPGPAGDSHHFVEIFTRGSVEKGELKPGGARAEPEDACGACWVRVGRRRWMANALVQARPNCWRKWILGVGQCRSGRRISDGRVWRKTTMRLQEEECHAERSSGGIRGTFLRRGVCWE